VPDEQPIPTKVNEPIPEPVGATDANLDGVIVDPDELDDEETDLVASLAAAAPAGTPTWAQVYALAKGQIAKYAPGRVRENVNDYTQWYYGNNTAAAFCFIFISWCLAHAASSANAGLALIGGKKAYVPYIRNIKGYHSGHSGMKVGAIVAINSFNHIGFCTRVSGSSFDLLSGNSVSGNSDDAVTVKTYPLSIASGYVNLAYAPAAPVDPNAYPGTVYKLKSPMMTGSHVKWIQTHLGVHGHKVTVDGQYGPKTAAAVKAFQKDAKLTQDSQVGPKTWAALAK
jgi:hypothetical protein